MSAGSFIVWVLCFLFLSFVDEGEAECELPGRPDNGRLIYQAGRRPDPAPSGYTIRVVCNDDARLHPPGDGFIECNSNGWSATYDCLTGCVPLPSIPHGEIQYRQRGKVARYQCTTPGYRLDGDNRQRCQTNLTWSGSQPRCRLMTVCPEIELPPGVTHAKVKGKFRDGLWTLGATHNFTCSAPGTFLDLTEGNYPAIKCLRNGWNASIPTCYAVTCAPLFVEIENGRTTAENRTYSQGEAIKFICDAGYHTTSQSWTVCSATRRNNRMVGEWENGVPECKVTRCPTLPSIDDGMTVSDSVDVGAVGTFLCHSGFTMVGDSALLCLSTGQWNGSVPVCEDDNNPSFCPALAIPLNGRKDGDRYDKHSSVTFHCDDGKTLIGSAVRECMEDGQWNGEPVRCMGAEDFDDINEIAAILGESMDGLKAASSIKEVIDTGVQGANSSRARFIPLKHDYGVDLYFIFDASSSVGKDYFDDGKKFAKELVKEIGVTNSSNSLRVAAMSFSSEAIVAFHTLDYDNTKEVTDAIDNIIYRGGGTNFNQALRVTREVMVAQSRAAPSYREKSLSTIFFITDGKSTEGGSDHPEAQLLKDEGVTIHCIGVSEAASRPELTEISSDPKREFLFFFKSYERLVSDLVRAVTNQSVDYSVCGVSSKTVQTKGEDEVNAVAGAWPWQVYLKITKGSSSNEYVCGGTLLRNDTILTAAHCFGDFLEVVAYVGITDRASHKLVIAQSRVIEPGDITTHENFDKATNSHDIALINLTRVGPFDLGPTVRPACLPDPTKEDRLLHRGTAILTGWGHSGRVESNAENFTYTPVRPLQQLPLPLKTRGACKASLRGDDEADWFDDTMTCAGYDNAELGACQGDSGGPLVKKAIVKGRRRWTVIGVVSWGLGCALPSELDFFANVPYFVPWIEDKMDRARDATTPAP